MASTQLARRLYLPSLAAELPEGWTVSEGATFMSPSGTAIHLSLNRAREGWDSSDLAAQMEAAARAEVVGINDMTASTMSLAGGRIAHQRRYTSERDGIVSIGRVICLVDGELALTVSATWAADGVAADDDMDHAVASVRLLSRPITNVPGAAANAETATARAPEKRPPVDSSAWSELRGVWSTARPGEVNAVECTRWSPAELAVVATTLGAPAFPTVGYEALAVLPQDGLSATLDVVTRSFLARGIIRAGEGGIAELSDEFREVMDIAVYPDLTILVERLGAPGNGRWWFGLRLDKAAQVTVLPDGSRDLGAIGPEQVVAHLLTLAGPPAMTTDSAAGTDPDRVTLADIANRTSRVISLARVNTAWRVDHTVRGGTFTWAIGKDGAVWLAELDPTASTPTWGLRPVDVEALRAELLAHLPGA